MRRKSAGCPQPPPPSRPIPADTAAVSQEPHGSLAVVPLIPDQRYYGEVTARLPRLSRASSIDLDYGTGAVTRGGNFSRIVKTPNCGETTSVPRCNPAPSRPHFAGGVATTPNALGCPYTQASVLTCTAPGSINSDACRGRLGDAGPAPNTKARQQRYILPARRWPSGNYWLNR